MKKSKAFKWALFLAVITVLATGCSHKNADVYETDASNNTTGNAQNPFEADKKDTAVMGSIGHGFAHPELDEKGKIEPLQYNGGELKIDYSVSASGKAKNVGFLVFVDGKPQPYKFNDSSALYEYMHIFNLKEDDKDTPFTFLFTPATGKKGDHLHVSIASVYNPAFIPDMKETISYGGYQTTLEAGRELIFNQDADALDASQIPRKEVLSHVGLSSEPVTKDMLEKHSGMEQVDMETLDTRVFSDLYIDGSLKHDNLKVHKSGTLHVTFKIFGHPGVKYRNTFYLNHKALSDKEGTSFETVLKKGDAAVVNADIDLGKLEDFNTFYVVSVPVNADDFPNDVVVLEKTSSLLLYK